MHAILASRRFLDRLTRWVAIVGFCGLVAVSLLTMVDGLSRHLGLPRITGFTDFSQVFFAVIIASCFPSGCSETINITITFVGKAFGRRGDGAYSTPSVRWSLSAFFVFVDLAVPRLYDRRVESGRTTRTILMAAGAMVVVHLRWLIALTVRSNRGGGGGLGHRQPAFAEAIAGRTMSTSTSILAGEHHEDGRSSPSDRSTFSEVAPGPVDSERAERRR